MIQGNLEYLMSSLPHLSFHNTGDVRNRIVSIFRKYAGPVHEEDDLIDILDAEAAKFLSPGKLQSFESLSLENVHKSAFRDSKDKAIAEFANWMYRLKTDLAEMRRARRDKRSQTSQTKRALPLEPGSPLEEEVQLLELQWAMADEITVGHHADFSALISYKLKLMILLRWWSFDAERGFAVFKSNTKAD